MAGGILKKGQAQQGESVRVEAKQAAFQPDAGLASEVKPAVAAAAPATPAAARPTFRQATLSQAKQEADAAAEQILADAKQAAADIAAQAEQAAGQLTANAANEASRLREEAEKELAARRGTLEQQVRAELGKEYQERYLKAVQALEGAAANIQRKQEEYLAAIEQPAFELVLAIARQVLGRELADAALSLPALIAQAFQLLHPDRALTVFVGPATFQQLSDSELFAQALASAGVRLERIELEIDPSLGEGKFRAESAGSHIDCDLPGLLDEVVEHLSTQASLDTGAEGAEA